MYFLQELSPIHDQWHRIPRTIRRLGFLLFHWHVIENFKKARGPSLWPGAIRPYTNADFTGFGWPYDVVVEAEESEVDSLASFSSELEGWHGDAHMAIGMATNTPMMDPRENIFYLQFWRLHYFINARFLEQLENYDGSGSVREQVRRLQRRHHRDVGRV